MGIKLKFASIAHPKTNGQVEKANGLICNGIKKRLLASLEKAKHAWVDELPPVLWSLRTTPNAATQETPLFLVHGAEACFQSISLMRLPELRLMMKLLLMKHFKTMFMHSMKPEMSCWLEPRNTSIV
jgi:hypothetical protein